MAAALGRGGRLPRGPDGNVGDESLVHAGERRLVRIARGVVRRNEVRAQRILVAVAVEASVLIRRYSPLALRWRGAKVEPAIIAEPELARIVDLQDLLASRNA